MRIIEQDTGGTKSFRFDALCEVDGVEKSCGNIQVTKAQKPIAGRAVWFVQSIDVAIDRRRQGIATKLYEAAAKEACRRRGHLGSLGKNRNPEAHSHDFWVKQERKGRAIATKTRSVKRGGGFFPTFIITDCPAPPLDGVKRSKR